MAVLRGEHVLIRPMTPDDVPQKGVNYFMLNSAKYNGQEGRKALHQIVEDALKKAGKGR